MANMSCNVVHMHLSTKHRIWIQLNIKPIVDYRNPYADWIRQDIKHIHLWICNAISIIYGCNIVEDIFTVL